MSIGRLRTGELLAAGGLVALLLTLFLDWFSVDQQARCTAGAHPIGGEACAVLVRTTAPASIGSGWGALGHPWLELLGLFALGLLVVLGLTLRAGPGRPTYGVMVSIVLTGALGGLVLVLTLIRVFLARPDGVLPGFADSPPAVVGTSLDIGTWIGLVAIVVALVGLWIAMSDDRTDAPESRFDPPAGRPVPTHRPNEPAGGPPAGPAAPGPPTG